MSCMMRFPRKYGLINSQTNKRAFNQDSSYCLLCSLEKLDDEGNFKGKADMFPSEPLKGRGCYKRGYRK